MALRILSGRLLTNSVPLRVSVTSSASMSSNNTPSTTSGKKTKKRESLRSMFNQLIGGNIDPADEKMGPIKAREVNLPNVVEKATGEEKLFLLAFENGIIDPYCNLPIERDGVKGVKKDNPIKIESFFDDRIVACACEPTQTFFRYTFLERGEPRRCHCGYWLELVDAPKFWQKLPKEDLIDIYFFRDLEERGLLDKYLAGEIDDKDLKEDHGHH